jgi:O-antigen/teichoic acid export membrane protein
MMYLASPSIAVYYNLPVLTDVLRIVASTFIIGAIGSVPDALIARDMRFKIYAGIDFMVIVLQCLVTLVLAWMGYGVWALVYGFVGAQLFKSGCVFYFSGWRPDRLGDLRAASELMRFGATVTYSRITWYLYTNSSAPIIGKVLNSQQVGIFSMAASLATLPTSHITSLVIQIAAPLFSRLQTDPIRLHNALLRLTSGIALITYPILVGMMLTAEQLVPLLLGPKWLEAVSPLEILCFLGLIKTVDPLITQAFISVNKAHVTAKYTTLCALVIPLCLYLGALFGGLTGVSISLVISYSFLSSYLFYCARKHLNLPLRRYFLSLRTPIEISITMGACVVLTQLLIQHFFPAQVFFLLLTKILVGMLCYVVFLIYGRQDSLTMLKEVAIDLGISHKKLDRWPFTRLKNAN